MSCSLRLPISLYPLWIRWKSEQIRISSLTLAKATPIYCTTAPRKTRLPPAPQSWIGVCRRLPRRCSVFYQPPSLRRILLTEGATICDAQPAVFCRCASLWGTRLIETRCLPEE